MYNWYCVCGTLLKYFDGCRHPEQGYYNIVDVFWRIYAHQESHSIMLMGSSTINCSFWEYRVSFVPICHFVVSEKHFVDGSATYVIDVNTAENKPIFFLFADIQFQSFSSSQSNSNFETGYFWNGKLSRTGQQDKKRSLWVNPVCLYKWSE